MATSRLRLQAVGPSIVVILAVAVPMAVGGVHIWTIAVATALAAAGMCATAIDASRNRTRVAVQGFGALLLGMAALSALQCVPLPQDLAAWLSPQGAAWYTDIAALTGIGSDGASAFPLSLDRAATAVEMCRLLCLALVFFIVAHTARERQGDGEHLLEVVALTGLIVLGIGVAQTVLKTGVLFGAYDAQANSMERVFQATFINENHLAGFLNLAGLVALGVAHGADRQRKTLFFGGIFAVCMVGSLASLSRGGAVAALAGCAFYGLLSFRIETIGNRRMISARAWLAMAIGVVTTAAILGYELIRQELSTLPGFGATADNVKLESWGPVGDLIGSFPLVGTGAGAFGDAFAFYNDVRPGVEFTHPENLLLQLAVDYGLPAAILITLVALLVAGPPLLRSTRKDECIGALAGLYAVVLQNMADFSLGILGVALPAAIVLGVLVGHDRRVHKKTRGVLVMRSWAWISVSIVALAAVVVSVSWHSSHGEDSVDSRLRAEVLAAASKEGERLSDSDITELLWQRPADHHGPYLVGRAKAQDGDNSAAERWFRGSLRRAPRSFSPRLWLARVLVKSNNDDARAATIYRGLLWDYWDRRDEILGQLLGQLRATNGDRDRAFALLDASISGDEEAVLDTCAWLLIRREKGWVFRLLSNRVQRAPDSYALRRELALLLVTDPQLRGEGSKQVTQLLARHPDRPGAYLLEGYILEQEDEHRAALAMFIEANERAPDDVNALLGRARVLLALNDVDGMRQIIGRVRPLLAGKPAELAKMHQVLSRASEAEGRIRQAIGEMEMAMQLDPTRFHYPFRLGALYEQIQNTVRARRAYEQALALEPSFAPAKRALENIE